MNVTLHRWLGAGVSAAMIAVALSVGFGARAPARGQPSLQQAQAQAPAAEPVAFLVRFRGDGPIARSQRAAAQGRIAPAQREIEAQLQRQSAFAGLCFDRFTVGAAEIVLRTCAPVAAQDRASAQQSWLQRLQAMRAVDYADANATVSQQQRAPG
ncbi:MAG: hypothetical protein JNK94_01010 [Hyphomonadaceae bacterium]|nr:hypothetical protein [Hyphomonadaceae bacterium]MBX3510839.1 hypothetical protein [Hyphomonadaceae bacterium]